MNKISAGAAITALFASYAHADSSVTLYGAVEGGIMYQSTSVSSLSLKAPSTGKEIMYRDGGLYNSIWGLTGREDLGGGYIARFNLRGAFSSGTGKLGLSDTVGAAAIFNQIATIGIVGPFGSIDIGRQIAPMTFALIATDVRAASAGPYFGSIGTAWNSLNFLAGSNGATTVKPIGGLFESNAFVYNSPSLAGASLALEYTVGGVAGSPQSGVRESIVVNYANYGLHVSGVYYQGHDTTLAAGATPTGQLDNRYVYLGARYTIQKFEVSASVSNGKNPSHSNQVDYNIYSAAAGYHFTPFLEITGGIYHISDRNNSNNKSTVYVGGVEYKISKSTMVYGELGYVNNQGLMNQQIAYSVPVAPGRSTTATLFGLRHTF